jgi:hypothetical protein
MAETVTLLAIVDLDGRVVAADLGYQSGDQSREEDDPAAGLIPLDGQRVVHIDVPREVLEVPGPDLEHFFSHVRVTWPAEVQLPEVEVKRPYHE